MSEAIFLVIGFFIGIICPFKIVKMKEKLPSEIYKEQLNKNLK